MIQSVQLAKSVRGHSDSVAMDSNSCLFRVHPQPSRFGFNLSLSRCWLGIFSNHLVIMATASASEIPLRAASGLCSWNSTGFKNAHLVGLYTTSCLLISLTNKQTNRTNKKYEPEHRQTSIISKHDIMSIIWFR